MQFNQAKGSSGNSKDNPGFADTPDAIVERLSKTGFYERLYGKQERYPFRQSNGSLLIHSETSGGIPRLKSIATESMTSKDICLLAPMFLYPGTRVTLSIRDLLGTEKTIDAKVLKCEHAISFHHVALIAFSQPIALDSFVVVKDSDHVEVEVDPKTIECKLLYIDDSALDLELIKHLLSKTKATVTTASTLEEALVFVKAGQPFDLVLCDANLGDTTGDKVITALRAAGLTAAACGITAETNPSMLNSLSRVTNGAIIHKPVTGRSLLASLKGVLDHELNAKIHSKYATKSDLKPMIAELVRAAKASSERLAQALGLQDVTTVRTICVRLKSNATACGFDVIAQSSGSIVTQLDAQASAKTVTPLVQRLVDQCRRMDISPAPKKVA